MNLKPLAKGLFNAVAAFSIGVFVIACSDGNGKNEDPNGPGGNGGVENKNLLPYSLHFTKEGDVVVLDRKGMPVESREIDFPIKEVTAIEDVQSFTSVIYKGSCVQILIINNKPKPYPLPDSFCK